MLIQQQKKEEQNASSNIDSGLWESLAGARTIAQFGSAWLSLQCNLIQRVVQGILILGEPDKGPFTPVSRWPEQGRNPERLAEVSERVLQERCGLLVKVADPEHGYSGSMSQYGMAYPIIVDERLHGAVAVELLSDSEVHLKTAMAHLQWGVSGMEVFFRRQEASENEALLSRLRSAVDLLASALSVDTFDAACMAVVTELSTQLRCDRVSLGLLKKGRARIRAISHSAQFGERMNLIRAIEKAMDEAVIQRKDIFYPIPAGCEPLITRDHEDLTRQHGAGCILTMPFYGKDAYSGVLTLERPGGFETEEASFCRSVGSLLFPALEIKQQNDRPLISKLMDAVKGAMIKLFGLHYLGRKVILLLAAAMTIFFYFAHGDYRISAQAILEGAVKRVVVAPFDGYVKEAQIRAGDVVEKGETICTLDDRDLRLERLNWLSKRTQYQRQHQEALAQHDWARAEIVKAQLDQAAAQLNLVEAQIERTRIAAPFKGLVISGDLTQRLGGSVGKGDVLFEVAPLDAYRVILEVDERYIADVKAKQSGRMILSSLPHEQFGFAVEKLTPIATAKEGQNYFRVEGNLESMSARLRPGMKGIGKIDVDRRRLIWIWTRDLIHWLRLWVWSWWP